MRFALVNPNWSFAGSVYFGCREPHLPLEYGYAKALLEREGHEAALIDGQLCGLSRADIAAQVKGYRPDVTVLTTAPSYLFWRCPPPELRVPQETAADVRAHAGALLAVGPHASSTPRATLRKLQADAVLLGEFEEVLPRLARMPRERWREVPSVFDGLSDEPRVPHVADMGELPPLRWPDALVAAHRHHHHRFDEPASGPGAEIEGSRGCPYGCSFCAKDNFRNRYRKRPLPAVLDELDALIAQGVGYVYFIDEIFMPDTPLLDALMQRPIKYGVQSRIDLWSPEMLDLLGGSGCVSVEAGVESVSERGRNALSRRCSLSTEEIAERLIRAKRSVTFVQANLIDATGEDPRQVEEWRLRLLENGVWANKPVPMFPFPGSPSYAEKWGTPDDLAWERAHDYYLNAHRELSDIQEQQPLPMGVLECRELTA